MRDIIDTTKISRQRTIASPISTSIQPSWDSHFISS